MTEDPAPSIRSPGRPRGYADALGKDGGFLQSVARTAVFNTGSVLLSAVAGVLIARAVGPAMRGEYAAVVTAFGIVVVLCELGLSAAVVYFVARNPGHTRAVARTSAVLLAFLSVLAVAVLLALTRTSLLGGGGPRTTGAYIMAAAIPVTYLAAAPLFALQSRAIKRWNVARIVQPLVALTGITILYTAERLTVTNALIVTATSILIQSLFAFGAYRNVVRDEPVTRGHSVPTRASLLRYGFHNVLAATPDTLNARVDQLFLAVAVSSRDLGLYAVAVSLSILVGPAVSAFGHVAFPKIAAQGHGAGTARSALLGAAGLGVVGTLTVVLGSWWLLVPVFGADYAASFPLLLALAPGSVFLFVSQVAGNILRGLGQPGRVAAAQWLGLLLTISGLVVLVPRYGAMGAAVTSSIVYAVVAAILSLWARGAVRRTGSGSGGARWDVAERRAEDPLRPNRPVSDSST